jgi:cytochrome o ubiquinol oxidase subunit I
VSNESGFSFFGKLSAQDISFVQAYENPVLSEFIAASAGGLMVIGAVIVIGLLTVYRAWVPLWSDWLTSVDHKKVGIMYVVLAFVMLARAIIEGVLIRYHQSIAVNDPGVLSPDHFGQLFSTHGSIMIFFVAMPFVTGVMNYIMPQQIGARDVSFPLLNAISLWLTAAGAALVMISLVVGQFSTGGWSAYPPYTGIQFSPGEGVDYWIWSVSLSSIGSTLTGVNFATTIYKNRAPGMTLFRMPMFCWTTLCTSILMIFAMAPLTVATLMLALDRYAGFHFFTNELGGNMMNYANLFWLFGHPEVYILILPAFVWLHHFFTMGQGANINAAFGIATMLIGVPTGVKVYDWLLTMVRGRIRLSTAMLFSVMFMVTFVLGGLTGVILANPPVDFAVHNSLFLVAHFHNMVIPGVLFGMIAAYQFWFPKAFGFRLAEGWGKLSFWCWASGFYLTFFPLYSLGLMGAMRRTVEWFRPDYLPWLQVSFIGAMLLLTGFFALAVQLVVSIRQRDLRRVPAGDPWDGRSLEWSNSAPPPEYNFAVIPQVATLDAFTEMKRQQQAYTSPTTYDDITVPNNSVVAPAIGVAAICFGFALVWHIWWLVIVSFVAIWGVVIARSFVTETERVIPAGEVRATHEAWLQRVRETIVTPREQENTLSNAGRAEVVA